MTDLVKELENWFKDRPLWLQDATRRLLEKDELEDADYNELLKICRNEASVKFEGDMPKAKGIPAGAFSQGEYAHKVKISSVSNIVGINALNPRKPLIFSEGLNVIYGQNGAGKSGYTRLLKQICGAKNPGQLHTDAFKDLPASQSCTIEYEYDGDDKSLNWEINQGLNEELSAVELYDSACGMVYVIDKNQLAYEPAFLRLFSQLTKTSDHLSDQLELLSIALVSAKPLIPNDYAATKTALWYRSIKADTREDAINKQCAWSEKNQKSLDTLNVRLKASDQKAKAQEIRKSKVQLDKLITRFQNWETKLNDESCASYLALKKGCSVKQLAASEYAKNIFENSPLTGIGEDAWGLLWEQARAYSETSAYSEHKFPNIDDEAVCVLCQQPLDEPAKKRLSDFEGFVKGELESAAKNAKEALDKLEEGYRNTPKEELIASFSTAAGLDDVMRAKVLGLRESIVQKSKDLLDTKEEAFFAIDFSVLSELIALSEGMDVDAKQLDEDAKEDKREEIKKEVLELEARKWISQQKDAITAEVLLLDKKAKIAQAKILVNTAALTRKKTSLADLLVTDEYIRRFQEEVKRLGAGRIKVKLEKTKSGKGKVYFQIKLEGNKQGLAVDKVLSEGEFRIISLAAFLADVEGHADKSTFIFDDPISSLDQDYEEKVTERLVELSKSRQVLVFTHRLSLMALLDEAVKKEGLQQNFIGLYKETWGSGEPGLSPIHAQKTKAAINTLIAKIPEGRNILNEQGNEPYTWWVKSVCTNTRITIEKVIEYDLLADVVQRFRRAINTQGKLHNVAKVTQNDCKYIDELMTKFSRYEHSHPNEAPVPPPEPDELEADLNELKKWRKDFVER